MGLLDFLFGRAENIVSPEEKIEEPVIQAPALIIPETPQTVLLKPLKWVVFQNKYIGIVVKLDSSNYAQVDFVDERGLTVTTDRVSCNDLRLAKYMEIPAERRPADVAYAAILGYV